MNDLASIIQCVRCGGALNTDPHGISCNECLAVFQLVDRVPVLFQGGHSEDFGHEGPLEVWAGYEPMVASIMGSIPKNLPILDIGAGNRQMDDPRIIRLDVAPTAFVDVVADAHNLPFKSDSFGLVYASAVLEHLRHPFAVAEEIRRVLRPGGHVIADCAFVFPFHGYPKTYFNASADGMRQLFDGFREVLAFVAPWQMPSYAIRAVLGEYLRIIRSKGGAAEDVLNATRHLEDLDLRALDKLFTQDEALRIAASTTFVGTKFEPNRPCGLLPDAVWRIWQRSGDLQLRYPDPWAPAQRLIDGRVDSLMLWATTEGVAVPEVRRALEDLVPFVK